MSDKDRQLIDRMIEWRRLNRPLDRTPIKTSLTPQALWETLVTAPAPHGAAEDCEYPLTLSYGEQVIWSKDAHG